MSNEDRQRETLGRKKLENPIEAIATAADSRVDGKATTDSGIRQNPGISDTAGYQL
ncbi:MAG: hypothetical protein IH613_02275 [Desulfuromonadales bacterium]|nr:hypothetical protein [Desulfuromonadales bacterium]